MNFKRLFLRALPAGVLLGLLLGIQWALGISAGETLPVAQACNPCDCPGDRRINCQGIEYYAVYTRVNTAGICNIDVFLLTGQDNGRRAFRVTPDEQAALPGAPAENLMVDSYYEVAMYKLTTGEYQVNAGPDVNGKVYVVRFRGCPATDIQEESFVVERPQ